MNRRGFTLIELLAVIVILSIILVVAVPNLLDTYKQSKLRSEGAFINQLSKGIESYVSLNGSNLSYNPDGKGCKFYTGFNRTSEDVDIFKNESITMSNVIDSGVIEEKDYINPGNRNKECNKDAKVYVYRDSDYVYCFRVEKDDLECLSDDYKETIEDEEGKDYKYVLDTCIWTNGECEGNN